MFKNLICLVVSLTVSAVAQAQLQALSQRQQEILTTAIGPAGYLDEDLYNAFWRSVPDEQDDRKELRQTIDQMMLVAQRYQRAVWSSALESARSGRVVRDSSIDKAYDEMVEAMARSAPRDQVVAMLKPAHANTAKLLSAAASKQVFSTPQGDLYVTEDFAREVLSGLDGGMARARLLMADSWSNELTEYVYADEGFKVLCLYPFRITREPVLTDDAVPAVAFDRRVSESESVSIIVVEIHSELGADDLESRMKAIVRQVGDDYGLADIDPVINQWRGHSTAMGQGKGSLGGKPIYVASLVAFVQEHNAVCCLEGVSSNSQLDADHVLADLQRNLQFLEIAASDKGDQ